MFGVVVTCALAALFSMPNTASERERPFSNSTARKSGLSRFGSMACGGAPICGLLALETGLGGGYYQHSEPTVHGLWPAIQPWGLSPCIQPKSLEPRRAELPECYNYPSPNPDHVRWFVEHSWQKHGMCAGVRSEDDFFAQICELSAYPLQLLREARNLSLSMHATVKALRSAGLPVYNTDENNGEVLLSACAVRDHHGPGYLWKLADASQFTKLCRSKPAAPGEQPECVPSMRGPACATNADCTKLVGCSRCTAAGFCTSRMS